jgi:hypothetical protein
MTGDLLVEAEFNENDANAFSQLALRAATRRIADG